MMADNNWDYNTIVDNDDRYPDKMAHQPAGAGWRTLIHYGQIIAKGKFQRFDFGKSENLKKYGQEVPPEYDLSKIKVPTALFTGDIDTLADQKDVKWLKEESGLNYIF